MDKSLCAKTPSRVVLAIAGNPNSGKSTLFNRLTGLRQKVGNFPGATVEKKTGEFETEKTSVELIDLPGTYSLIPKSEEERIASEIILGTLKEIDKPQGVLCLVDSTCLEKSLYLVLQVIQMGVSTALLLNMRDELARRGSAIDIPKLSKELGIPVVPLSATQDENFDALLDLMDGWPKTEPPSFQRLPILPSTKDVMAIRRRARDIADRVILKPLQPHPWSDQVDTFVMHPVWGSLLFGIVVMTVFQAIFSWAKPFMDAIDSGFMAMSTFVRHTLPEGFWNDFVSDGVIAGVGSVLVFLPQILIVFFFIAILENLGYLPRAAAVMDRVLSVIGLQGKSFLPLISSYACAIPGIMATRTIENRHDRLATIFVAPFMTCSARLPVYALLIGAFVPDIPLLGNFFGLRALTLLGLYAVGFGAALGTAWILKSSILKSSTTPFFIEIPPFRIPDFKVIVLLMWDRTKVFLQQAGTVILLVNIVLWFLISYPKKPGPEGIRHSFAGQIGTLIEPVIRPLGFDWKIGIGLLSAQAAREVIVSTLQTIYRVDNHQKDRTTLQKALRSGMTPLSAVSLMIFFALAMQCMSTLAVARHETGGWKIPMMMFIYMNTIAWLVSFTVYQVGRALGWGSG